MTSKAGDMPPKRPSSIADRGTTASSAHDTTSSPLSPLEGVRPSIAKLWQTERPIPATKAVAAPPQVTRWATNLPASDTPEWVVNDESTSESSSSDSSSEEDRPRPTRQSAGRTRKHIQNRKGNAAYSRFNIGNDDYNTKGRVSKRDGRLRISVNETSNRGYLAKALGANFLKDITAPSVCKNKEKAHESSESSSVNIQHSNLPPPSLNIVVMVIGSRGDIQPFLKLGKDLKEYGHRVRIATHPAFKEFVENDSGLEFFSVGGDPAELMAFMVKNPGMIPTMETLKTGEIGRRRDQMAEMFDGFWRACINATDDEKDTNNLKMLGENAPFVADAIIANPPSFAHVHCAERLGIPLHLMFTFPYTPTQSFPHPLANIKHSNIDPGYTNFMSYPLVEMMTWQGLGDLVNDFRVRTLGLEPVSTLWAPGQLYRLKVPYTYLWSPGLVPKPKDWGPEIDIAGFVFLDLASTFKPPKDLQDFLNAGEPPVYIGFGSIVVDDPDKFTKTIFEAVEKAQVRALVSKGWGGLGDDNVPDNIFMLENTPHDWLFPKVKAVVHHGGAGTTAIGLKCGKPTMVVPFFGDQQFWGAMIAEAGAGSAPVPYKKLTSDNLADGIKECLSDEACKAAQKIAASIEAEGDGAKNAVDSFHRSLVLAGPGSMRCSILEDRVAVWILKNTHLRLSAKAAELLVEQKRISWKQLRLIRHNEWNDFEGPGEPITGVGHALKGAVTGVASGIGGVPFKIAKVSKRRARQQQKKRRQSELSHSEKEKVHMHDITKKQKQSSTTSLDMRENKNILQPDIGTEVSSTKPVSGEDAQIESSDVPESSAGDAHNTTLDGGDGNAHADSKPVEQKDEAADADGRLTMNESIMTDEPKETTAEEIAQDLGSGVGKTMEAVALAPLDLSVAVAQGFHNAPRLYGDSTVRRPTRITGMKSGLKAAGEEFAYGVYDGVTGLVLQPYHGARNQGAVGFVKGVGMGFTGFILKDLAAILGPFAYTAKGLHKQMTRRKQPTNFIRKARIMQGQRELLECDEQEKKIAQEMVSHGWSVVQQFWALMDQKRSEGLRGKVDARKERHAWKSSGAFENVQMAEKALQARKNGESLEGVFAEQAREKRLMSKPRRNVIDNVQEGDLTEDEAVNEPDSMEMEKQET